MSGVEASGYWLVDDLGPEKVLFLRLPLGCTGVVVVDNVVLGTAIGGVRMTTSVDSSEVARLARAMTLKNAAAGLPHGGAKAGINTPDDLSPGNRERVIRAFAVAIRGLTEYVPGPDMGTDETAMAWVRDEIGRSVGIPAALGGIPLDDLGATGFGLAVCAETLAEAGVLELAGARAVIQGFGAVGRHAALRLAERGVTVVAVSDSRGATYAPDGLDVGALVAFKRKHSVADFPGGTPVPRDDVLRLDCEVLVPAAQADVITKQNADGIRARVVLQGANIPATAEAERMLHARGVLVVPDIVANAGGVICAAVEYRGGDREAAFAAIRTRSRESTQALLERLGDGVTEPRAAAVRMARERLEAAQAYRRRF